MYKIAKIIAIVLGVIGLVLWLMLMRLGEGEVETSSVVDFMLNLGIWMTVILALVTIVLSFFQLLTHPEKLKKALISAGAFILVIVISYFVLSTGSDLDFAGLSRKGIEVTEATSKWVGAGLWAFYLLAGIAVLAMVISGFKKPLSK
ncbi:hypothetical protein [Robertkochia solimangrovi]|uniref:hypothetical protein n=1 Tax=Robertkochia solimangrovi TaxID=2213046 RepID=UPI00118001A6|nr:hypothetical protein [Robertkochia solimangrovi]TRZ46364.1 hypothetical protein DMZ48_03685 [Robertkochia solimangrovi]